eukprot:393421-Pleurochrysis_carterae.AAC.3
METKLCDKVCVCRITKGVSARVVAESPVQGHCCSITIQYNLRDLENGEGESRHSAASHSSHSIPMISPTDESDISAHNA